MTVTGSSETVEALSPAAAPTLTPKLGRLLLRILLEAREKADRSSTPGGSAA